MFSVYVLKEPLHAALNSGLWLLHYRVGGANPARVYSVWPLSVSPVHLWYMYQQKSSVTGKPSHLHSEPVKALSDDAIKHPHYASSGPFSLCSAAIAFIFSLRASS